MPTPESGRGGSLTRNTGMESEERAVEVLLPEEGGNGRGGQGNGHFPKCVLWNPGGGAGRSGVKGEQTRGLRVPAGVAR